MCNCSCNAVSICLGELTYVLTKIVQCMAATTIVTCVMATLVIILGLGVGTGYHYCYVENKINETLKFARPNTRPEVKLFTTSVLPRNDNKPPAQPTKPIGRRKRSKDNPTTPLVLTRSTKKPKNLRHLAEHESANNLEPTTEPTIVIKPTMIVPLNHCALMILIRDLQKKNMNFTLELIAHNKT